ncbi:MAG: hypothetical protein H0V80_18810 [Acidobacteria bacterium]|nr:hypothetical protein [Acidobacteriota bacterium]
MSRGQRRGTGQALFGTTLVTLGAMLFAQNAGLLEMRVYWRYWPLLLIALGAVKLLSAHSRVDTALGIGMLVFGSGRLSSALGYWSPRPPDLVALVMVTAGGWLIYRGLVSGRDGDASNRDQSDWISAFAVMGGFKRANNSPTFRGADLSVVMGGFEIDLRQASLRAPATIDVFVMWGGIEVRVPEDWTVELRGVPILAGFEDKTRAPTVPTERRLIVRGMALMGGVEIKN